MRTLSMRIVTRHILRQRITIENLNILANFRIKSKSLEILILLGLIYAKKSPSKISRLGTFNNLFYNCVLQPFHTFSWTSCYSLNIMFSFLQIFFYSTQIFWFLSWLIGRYYFNVFFLAVCYSFPASFFWQCAI